MNGGPILAAFNGYRGAVMVIAAAIVAAVENKRQKRETWDSLLIPTIRIFGRSLNGRAN